VLKDVDNPFLVEFTGTPCEIVRTTSSPENWRKGELIPAEHERAFPNAAATTALPRRGFAR
jgi:hypothetical protein